MITVTVTKAGIALCLALRIAHCDYTEHTADELFSVWMNQHGPQSIFYCNPAGCHSIAEPYGGLPKGIKCHVPLDYHTYRAMEYEDRGNYVFCEPALTS